MLLYDQSGGQHHSTNKQGLTLEAAKLPYCVNTTFGVQKHTQLTAILSGEALLLPGTTACCASLFTNTRLLLQHPSCCIDSFWICAGQAPDQVGSSDGGGSSRLGLLQGAGPRIYVGGIPNAVSETMVRNYFSNWGKVCTSCVAPAMLLNISVYELVSADV